MTKDIEALDLQLAKLNCSAVEVYFNNDPNPGYLPGGIVLALRLEPVFPDLPYVTWGFNEHSLFSGHYDMSLDRARADFAKRVESERS